MRRQINSIPISRPEIFAAMMVVAVAAVIFLRDPRLVFVAVLAVPLLVIFKKPSLILYLLTGIALMRIDAWASYALSIPFGKVVFLLTGFSMILVLFLTRTEVNKPGMTVRILFTFLATYFIFGLINASSRGTFLWLQDSAYAVSYFVVVYLLVNSFSRLEKVVYLIAGAGIIVSLLNVVEFFNPRTVTLSQSLGRAAGLLKNANTSALVINVAMIAILYPLRVASSRIKALVLVLAEICCFLGVFTTFSREGIIIFSMIFAGQFFIIRQRSRRFMIIAVAGILVTVAIINIMQYISLNAIGDVRYSFQKISTLVQGQVDDNGRLFLLKFHLGRFARHPFTGNGLYSAMLYSIDSAAMGETMVPNGPHNTFVLILSETGIVPLLVYILFLTYLFRNVIMMISAAGSDLRKKSLALCIMFLFGLVVVHHIFSHMLIVSRYSMVLFALSGLPHGLFSPSHKNSRS